MGIRNNVKGWTFAAFAALLMGLAAFAPAAEPAAAPDVLGYFPKDTILLVQSQNFQAAQGAVEQTALGKIWADPEMQAFVAEAQARLKTLLEGADKATDFKMVDLKSCLSTQAVAGVIHTPEVDETALLIALRAPDEATAQRFGKNLPALLKYLFPGLDWKTAKIDPAGASSVDLQGSKLSFAVQGKAILVSYDKSGQALAGALQRAGQGGIRELPAFQKTMEKTGAQACGLVYLNTRAIWDGLTKEAQENPESKKTMAVLWNLGLMDIQGVGLGVRAAPPGFMTTTFISAPEPRRGLFACLSEKPVGKDLAMAAPATAKVFAASSLAPEKVLPLLREAFVAAGEDPRQIDVALAALPRPVGMNLEQDLLNALAGDAAVVVLDPDAVGGLPFFGLNGLVVLLRVKDEAAMGRTMDALADFAAKQAAKASLAVKTSSQKRGEATIRSLGILGCAAPSFTIYKNLLILGAGPQAVSAVVDTIDGKTPALGADPEFLAVAKQLGGADCPGFSYASRVRLSSTGIGMTYLSMAPAVILPTLFRSRAMMGGGGVKGELTLLARATEMYHMQNEKYPATLQELVEGGFLDGPELADRYAFLPASLNQEQPAIIAFEADDHNGTGRNVAFRGGRTERMDEAAFQAALAELKKDPQFKLVPPKAAPAKAPKPEEVGPILAFINRIEESPEAFMQEALEAVPLSRLPSMNCFNRHLFASGGARRATADGLVLEQWGPLPLLNGTDAFGGFSSPSGSLAAVGVIGAFAIPNLLRSRMVTNEIGAIAGLKALVNHEEIYNTADADGNGVKDYLTSELAGFYTTKNALGNEIKMIDVAFARADFTADNGVSEAKPTLPAGAEKPTPKSGYRFTAMKTLLDADGNPVVVTDPKAANVTKIGKGSGLDEKATGHPSLWGFCAYPDAYGKSGQRTFIVNQEGQVYGVDNGGKPCLVWPGADPTTVDAGNGRRWGLAE